MSKQIVEHLNKAPFSKELSLVRYGIMKSQFVPQLRPAPLYLVTYILHASFDALDAPALLQVVNDVVAEISPDVRRNHVTLLFMYHSHRVCFK